MTSTDELDYDLPEAAIAQVPAEPRDAARLLVDAGPADPPVHRTVADLPALVGPGDLLVVNDTRVIPARLHLRKPTGGAVEVLLLERVGAHHWEALVRPSRRVQAGTVVEGAHLRVEVGEDLGDGRRAVTLLPTETGELDAIDDQGEVPLPPYIHEPLVDPERYQTVFNEHDGRWADGSDGGDRLRSVAAPTAGLHLTAAVLDACRAAGAEVRYVRLAVGLGTFRPITTDRLEDHAMHGERLSVPRDVLDACQSAGRVVAVGTTVVRALESAVRAVERGEDPEQLRTELFIHGDFPFRVVDRLLTNFHVPRSSLLAMIDAFVGPRWLRLYETALAERYRFLSFGDAMLLSRQWGRAA